VYGSIYRDKREEALRDNNDPSRVKRLMFDLSPVLLVAKVVAGRVFPAHKRLEARCATRTISDTVGRANVPGYDAHFALVKHTAGAVFDPVTSADDFDKGEVFTELVTFDVGQVLPIAILRPSVEPSLAALKSVWIISKKKKLFF
jgi:hypothetical protein